MQYRINNENYYEYRKTHYSHNASSFLNSLGNYSAKIIRDSKIKAHITHTGTYGVDINFYGNNVEEEMLLFKLLIQNFEHINMFKEISNAAPKRISLEEVYD